MFSIENFPSSIVSIPQAQDEFEIFTFVIHRKYYIIKKCRKTQDSFPELFIIYTSV